MTDLKPKQIDVIKTRLINGEPVDSVLAFENHHITRFAPIIERLRKRGWPVATNRQDRLKLWLEIHYENVNNRTTKTS